MAPTPCPPVPDWVCFRQILNCLTIFVNEMMHIFSLGLVFSHAESAGLIISAKKVIFYPAFLYLFVCLFVCYARSYEWIWLKFGKNFLNYSKWRVSLSDSDASIMNFFYLFHWSLRVQKYFRIEKVRRNCTKHQRSSNLIDHKRDHTEW